MPSELPSFIRLHQGLNAIATPFLRRAFAGAMLAQRHFRRSPHTILEQPAAPSATQRRASSALAGHAKRPYRYLHGATTSAAMARRSRDRTACKPGQL